MTPDLLNINKKSSTKRLSETELIKITQNVFNRTKCFPKWIKVVK